MRKILNQIADFGKVEIKLKDFIDRKEITRNSLAVSTNIRYSIIGSYYKNKVARIDLFTLAKICYVLECDISDILEYKE